MAFSLALRGVEGMGMDGVGPVDCAITVAAAAPAAVAVAAVLPCSEEMEVFPPHRSSSMRNMLSGPHWCTERERRGGAEGE